MSRKDSCLQCAAGTASADRPSAHCSPMQVSSSEHSPSSPASGSKSCSHPSASDAVPAKLRSPRIGVMAPSHAARRRHGSRPSADGRIRTPPLETPVAIAFYHVTVRGDACAFGGIGNVIDAVTAMSPFLILRYRGGPGPAERRVEQVHDCISNGSVRDT